MNRAPKHNRCDSCGRNVHKVAIRKPEVERNPDWTPSNRVNYYRPTGRMLVLGYCPSCTPTELAEGSTLIYDRRALRTRNAKPITRASV